MSNSPTAPQLTLAGNQTDALPTPNLMTSIHALRLTQGPDDLVHGSSVLVSVPVAKPPKACFFRVKLGEQCSASFNVLDASKMGGDGIFAVGAAAASLIPDHVRRVQLRQAVTSRGATYLIPVNLPDPDGRWNAWHQSLAGAVELAESRWIRISADMARGSYNVFEAKGHLAEPQWPAEAFNDLLEIAFRDRMITADDHPLIQQLLGNA